MHGFPRKAAVTVGTMAAALTLSPAGARAAQGGEKQPGIPVQGARFSSLHACLTTGNTLAQKGAIVAFDCRPAGGGAHTFHRTA